MQNAIPYFRQQDIGSNHVPSVFTDPLKRVTRSALAKYNEECRSEHGMYWSDVPTAQQTVLEIERALSAMPRSGDRNIDAQEFNPETPYQGNMVFRGAIAANRQTDRPIYVPDGAPGGIAGGLRTGDYVTNTDLMSTSAVAAVAGEFVMRQRLKVPESNPAKYVAGKNHAEYDERRILFTIDHQSGRPIAQYSQEQQAEVLFCRGAVFKIEKIDKSDYGVIVRLAERPGGCWAPDTGQFTGIAEAPGAKIHNMMIGGEVPKIDVYSPPAPTRE